MNNGDYVYTMPMRYATSKARETMCKGYGGPFGAAITDNRGNIISVASNTVLLDHDPTAHAEVNAIREACKKLGTHDLKGYRLYATSEPCPMCLSAIMWANIDEVYYGCTADDAAEINFRDSFIYEFIEGGRVDDTVLNLIQLDREGCLKLFEEYKTMNGTIY